MSNSKYADEGTIAHALAAMALTEGRPASAYINRVIACEDYPHSELSPSGAHRWMRCPGSTALEARIAFKPRKFSQAVDHDMAAAVQIYLDNLKVYMTGPGRTPNEMLIEQKLPIGHITGEEGAAGSGDVVILDFKSSEIQVHDLKFGRGVEVSAENNEQLALYLLGALELFKEFDLEGWKTFRSVIHQPRISATPSEYVWTCEELLAFAKVAKDRAALAVSTKQLESLDGVLFPGDEQCRFCDAKATCPALARQSAETALGDFENLDTIVPATTKLVPVPADSARLALYLTLVPRIEEWCKAIAARAEAELLAGNPVPGYKLVQGKRGNRAWGDEAAAEALLKSFRLKQEEMYSFKLISPTQAEKVLKEQPKRWSKAQALVTQSDGSPSVVPESDKRPALEVKPALEDFSNLDDQQELV